MWPVPYNKCVDGRHARRHMFRHVVYYWQVVPVPVLRKYGTGM